MGIIQKFTDTDEKKGYTEFTEEHTDDSSGKNNIVFADIDSHNSINDVIDAVNDDKIIIVSVAVADSNGISVEKIENELGKAVDRKNGDIVRKRKNEIIILAPQDVNIDKQKL
jgi:SepF-like predicted cell division protein (DUF552 family)